MIDAFLFALAIGIGLWVYFGSQPRDPDDTTHPKHPDHHHHHIE